MNIATAGAGTSRANSAGPMTTQLMMNDAVTGTASPRIRMATAARTALRISTTVGSSVTADAESTSRSDSTWPGTVLGMDVTPRPVLVMVETTWGAAAHTAATGRTERTPSDSDR